MRVGLGNFVPLVSFQLLECRCGEMCLASVARVSLGFGQRLVPEDGHNFIGAAAGFGEPAPCGLPQSMRLAIEWKAGRSDRATNPLAKAVDSVRLTGSANELAVAAERGEIMGRVFDCR